MSQKELPKLSQWDALLVEGLRRLGWSDDELIERVRRGTDLPADDSIYQFNYADLAAFAAREPETFEAAVRGGYRIKYNTVRGIRSWIAVAFGKEPELELAPGRESVAAELTPAEKERVVQALSFGWTIAPVPASGGSPAADGASLYRIEPISR